jgi:cell division septation protein DedD
MKRKIFVNKDSHSGFRSSLKFLLWAAIGLVILVLFIPLTSRQKAGKEVAKKPPVEKGKVVKEIPRSLQPIAESLTRGQGEPSEAPKEADSRPMTTPAGKAPGAATTPAPATLSKDKPAEPPATPQKVEPTAEGSQKNLAGHSSPPEPVSSQVRKETQPTQQPPAADTAAKEAQGTSARKPEPTAPPPTETKPKTVAALQPQGKPAKPSTSDAGAAPAPTTAVPDSQKPAAAGRKTLYTVQIATLKDKQSAEELKKSLQKKGFEVVLKTTGDPKQGQSFTLQLQPVDNISKASTLMEQVKYVPQTKPSIVTLQPGN